CGRNPALLQPTEEFGEAALSTSSPNPPSIVTVSGQGTAGRHGLGFLDPWFMLHGTECARRLVGSLITNRIISGGPTLGLIERREGFEPSIRLTTDNGFRGRRHFAQPSGERRGVRVGVRESR